MSREPTKSTVTGSRDGAKEYRRVDEEESASLNADVHNTAKKMGASAFLPPFQGFSRVGGRTQGFRLRLHPGLWFLSPLRGLRNCDLASLDVMLPSLVRQFSQEIALYELPWSQPQGTVV